MTQESSFESKVIDLRNIYTIGARLKYAKHAIVRITMNCIMYVHTCLLPS